MTPDELDEIETAANAATKGPWKASVDMTTLLVVEVDHGRPGLTSDDATFIARAREWVPALVAEVRRLKGLLAE